MSDAAITRLGAICEGATTQASVLLPATASPTSQDHSHADGWRHRLVFGMTGLALLAILLCGALFLVTLGSPLPDDALVGLPRAQSLARLDAYVAYSRTLNHIAWLLHVIGATTWLPLCSLFCVRIYIRDGWTRAIPIVLAAALITSTAVAVHAWHSCSAAAGSAERCW